MKRFAELDGRESLALAILREEEQSQIYQDYADVLEENCPALAKARSHSRLLSPQLGRLVSRSLIPTTLPGFGIIFVFGEQEDVGL